MKRRGSKQEQAKKREEVIRFLKKYPHAKKDQAARALKISVSAIGKIWRKYKNAGSILTPSKKRGPQQGVKLKKPKAEKLLRAIRRHRINEPNKLLSVADIQAYAANELFVTLSRWQIKRYLENWKCLSSWSNALKTFPSNSLQTDIQIIFISKNEVVVEARPDLTSGQFESKKVTSLSAVKAKGNHYFRIYRGKVEHSDVEAFIWDVKMATKRPFRIIIQKRLKSNAIINFASDRGIPLSYTTK